MKTPIFFSLVVVLLLIILVVPVYATQFINKDYNIKFDYPMEWKLIPYDNKNYNIEYDTETIAFFDLNPSPSNDKSPKGIEDFILLDVYTKMDNLEEFYKVIKEEMIQNKGYDIEILDVEKIGDETTPQIYRMFTKESPIPIIKGIIAKSSYPSHERMYFLFQGGNIGYKIQVGLSPEQLEKKMQQILYITNQLLKSK